MRSYRTDPLVEVKTISSKLRSANLVTKCGDDMHWLPGDKPHDLQLCFIDGVSDEGKMTLIELIELTADVAGGEELIVEVVHRGDLPGSRVCRFMEPRIVKMFTSNERQVHGASAQIILNIEYSHLELHDIIEA